MSPILTIVDSCFLFRVKHIFGYEVVPQAISDARVNAELNNICNTTFIQGDLNKIDENFGRNFPKPDVVISGCFLLLLLQRSSLLYCTLRPHEEPTSDL